MKTSNILLGSLAVVLIIAVLVSPMFAAKITGVVYDPQGSPIGGANVLVKDQPLGASTNLMGEYQILNIPNGKFELVASFIGYQSQSAQVEIANNRNKHIDFTLEVDALKMKELVIKHKDNPSRITVNTPVRKEIIAGSELREQSRDSGLLSALDGQTGLNTRPCALCGSAGIGMQGLDASYTEVNVDGLAVLSGVGSLYGMEGISVNSLSNVTLTKGSGSAEAGSGAIGGSVNLTTRQPGSSNDVGIGITGASTYRHGINLALNHSNETIPVNVTLDYTAEPELIDRNNDNLTDSPRFNRVNLGISNQLINRVGTFKSRVRLYREQRFAGDVNWEEDDRGSSSVYGRDIRTERTEISLKYQPLPASWGEWSVESAIVDHRQDSWYGATEFDAQQLRIISRVSAAHRWSELHASLVQGLYTFEDYSDNLALSAPTDRIDRIPGLMYQHTWTPIERVSAEAGIRIENFQDDNVVPTLRGSALYRMNDEWSLRVTSGTGYRPITIFSLDKAVHAGFDNVTVPTGLKPERSISNSISVSNIRRSEFGVLIADINLFRTDFSEKAILAFGHETGTTVYTNASEAYSQGFELQVRGFLNRDYSFRIGGTFTDIQFFDGSDWQREEMQNRYTGQLGLGKKWVEQRWKTNLGVKLFGPQYLPEGRGRSKSPVFAIADWSISKGISGFDISLSVENLTNWIQGDNPFISTSDGNQLVDSALIYGPLLGRSFHISINYLAEL